MKICSACGTNSFEQDFTHANYCQPCWNAYQRARYNGELEQLSGQCRHCGTPFTTKNRRKVYCARKCKDAFRDAEKASLRMNSKPQRRCVWCSVEMPKSMRADARFCSETCNSAAHQGTRKMLMRAGFTRREAPLVLRSQLAARDGLDCYLCSDPLDLRTAHPDPLYASIDHFTPLARGGTNELSNLRLAHLVCNLRKRADLIDSKQGVSYDRAKGFVDCCS
ncbi:HNH endonuclease signature motif containing protein [Micromonospora sp. NPDC049044]|uniref:HNH endonuclease n=1 Tax=Micromonospora sp. NPDC049044 TaxID=3154827 RepID=UPI0033FE0E05